MARRLLIPTLLVFLLAGMAGAVPFPTAEYGTVPVREYSPAQDECYLGYYNICSGWVYYWTGYCYMMFCDAPNAMYGTCFDLQDCPGDCRHLTDIWWAVKRFNSRGTVNVELYCASEYCCPIGPPLWGIYDYVANISTAWQHFVFDGLPLCVCEDGGAGKFIFMVTDLAYGCTTAPYSDINHLNIEIGCETEWRCGGTHSFIYRNAVVYCDVYGQPGPMWVSGPDYGCTNFPAIPPGCHDYFYINGFFTEFLVDCYISCQGATETEDDSWGEVKRLYK
jgi:hypothetical protein